jgi:uncharacterized protein YukE
MQPTLVRPGNVSASLRLLKGHVQMQRSTLAGIDEEIASLGVEGVWQGEAKDVLDEGFKNTKKSVTDFLEIFESFIQLAQNSVDTLVDTDNSIRDMMRKSVAKG